MAINISQQPQELVRSGNAITSTFTSDKTNESNFAFIVDVYKNGVLHSEHRVHPENGTYGRFDLSEIAELETKKPNIPTSVYADAGNYADFYIVVKEFYGIVPIVGLTATSSITMAFKSKQGIYESFYYADYYPTPFGGKLMTYFDKTTLYLNELFYLYALKLQGDPYVHLDYRNSNNNAVYANDVGLVQHDCLGIGLSYQFLESNFAGASFTEVAYILVTITDGTDYYNEYRIDIVQDTSCVVPTRIHWLNKIGGMESFSFTRPARETQQTKVQSYETAEGNWYGTFYGNSDQDTGNATFQTTSKKSIELESGFVSEANQRIIYDNLFTSPYILIEWEQRLIRVSRSDITASYKKDKLDQLFNVKIKVNIENFKSAVI